MADNLEHLYGDTDGYSAIVANQDAVNAGIQIAKEYLASCADEVASNGGQGRSTRSNSALRENYKNFLARLEKGEEVAKDGLLSTDRLSLHVAQYIRATKGLGATAYDAVKLIGDWAVTLPAYKVPTAIREYL